MYTHHAQLYHTKAEKKEQEYSDLSYAQIFWASFRSFWTFFMVVVGMGNLPKPGNPADLFCAYAIFIYVDLILTETSETALHIGAWSPPWWPRPLPQDTRGHGMVWWARKGWKSYAVGDFDHQHEGISFSDSCLQRLAGSMARHVDAVLMARISYELHKPLTCTPLRTVITDHCSGDAETVQKRQLCNW